MTEMEVAPEKIVARVQASYSNLAVAVGSRNWLMVAACWLKRWICVPELILISDGTVVPIRARSPFLIICLIAHLFHRGHGYLKVPMHSPGRQE